jgi:murein DD-endopeptidase MepM/ murein hydrolase activator NlpD
MYRRGSIFTTVLYILLPIIVVYGIFFSNLFDKEPPQIAISDQIYWNMQSPIPLDIKDNGFIKHIDVKLINENGENSIIEQKIFTKLKETNISIQPTSEIKKLKSDKSELLITVRDDSLWNFFLGNTSQKRVKLIIDQSIPYLSIVTNSYSIAKGGSSVVILEAKDDNIKEIYFKDAKNKKYQVSPFIKKDYYIAMLPWQIDIDSDSVFLKAVAVDKAGNKSETKVRFFLKNKDYKVSNIQLKDNFLDGKISQISTSMKNYPSATKVEKFVFVNETMRRENESLIHEVSSNVPKEIVSDFSIKPFYPLPRGAVVALFGDHRIFNYNNTKVSESFHMGIDLASNAGANIISSNSGKLVFLKENGIFGLVPVIDHGLGLYSLYGHCTTSNLKEGDNISSGHLIATTGTSGLALGDHLHFGIVVQGVDVSPIEWMDANWIRINITDIINSSKILIANRK